ncbi:hypothetical protein HOH51_01950 [bacterium]|jgi:hypothetical protein|nr:hypothetical protein [bacterium]
MNQRKADSQLGLDLPIQDEVRTIDNCLGTLDEFFEPTPASVSDLPLGLHLRKDGQNSESELSLSGALSEAQNAKIFEVLEDLSQVNPVLNKIIDFIAVYRTSPEVYSQDEVLEWVLESVLKSNADTNNYTQKLAVFRITLFLEIEIGNDAVCISSDKIVFSPVAVNGSFAGVFFKLNADNRLARYRRISTPSVRRGYINLKLKPPVSL